LISADSSLLTINEYSELLSNVSKILERNFILRVPYAATSKAQIIKKLFLYDIYEETWFCETPKDVNKPCYNCTPCNTHSSALASLEFKENDGLVKIKALNELAKFKEKANEEVSKLSKITEASNEIDRIGCTDDVISLEISSKDSREYFVNSIISDTDSMSAGK
jgi:hypothetical protein